MIVECHVMIIIMLPVKYRKQNTLKEMQNHSFSELGECGTIRAKICVGLNGIILLKCK